MTTRQPNKNTSIVILGEGFAFPHGMAATSRVTNLAKGMAESGAHVYIYCIRGTENNESPKNIHPSGQLNKFVNYEYTGGSTVRSSNWLIRRWDDFHGMLGAYYRLYKLKNKTSLIAVILYSRNPSVVSKFCWFCKLLRIKVILELCEWPLATTKNNNKRLKSAQKFCTQIVPQVDGVIPISSYIEKQVQKIVLKKNIRMPSIKIPILIEGTVKTPRRPQDTNQTKPMYMLYTGSLAYQDIALIVLDTCIELKKRNILLPIKITGGASGQNKLRTYAKKNNILEYLDFVGYVDDEHLVQLQCNAKLLLAPLPNNLQSISRFPTKIGHYLMSGRPVVTTLVGEVPLYLTDEVNAFIAPSCEPNELANKIEQIYNNPDKANTVGKNGTKLAEAMFHFKIHGKRLMQFIENLS